MNSDLTDTMDVRKAPSTSIEIVAATFFNEEVIDLSAVEWES